MTVDAALQPEQDEQLFCFRHPDRETWIRCGRCEKPICTKCGVMGPVGMRCKDCGRLRNDPLTSFTPVQLVLGLGVAVAGGVLGGYLAGSLSIFAIFLGFIGGGFLAETVVRVVGYKRGPVMQGIVLGGIVVGALLGLGLQYWSFASAPGSEEFFSFPVFLSSIGVWALIFIGAACAGAWSRIR